MQLASNFIAVLGAAGHTGQFVVKEAMRRGLPVMALGRSLERLEAAFGHSVPQRAVDLGDPASLKQALAGCGLVINCAGPFLDTAAPVIEAALAAGCHYIDVTAEQASAQASFVDFDTAARAARRVVMPAAGFYGGLADLLASALAAPGDIDAITVAVALDNWWPTSGTRVTGERNQVPRVVVEAGQLVPLAPSADAPDWTFSAPLGKQQMVDLPFSEIITLAHHLPAHAIRSLLNQSALKDVRDADTPPPKAVDDFGRSAQQFELVVQLQQGGVTKTASARGQDIYAVTAPIVVEVAERLLAPDYEGSGALALAQALDPKAVLAALQGRALDVSGDITVQ
jgi:hypothetical protein